ncbi:zinc finger protein 493-like [Battus philenor]|uniref:zinc finger protein 493-like n=1 Tax=Battus philenor TaxID=42288 RepID=UPI0035CEAD99
MNLNISVEVDPLATYDFPQFSNYPPPMMITYQNTNTSFQNYVIKNETCQLATCANGYYNETNNINTEIKNLPPEDANNVSKTNVNCNNEPVGSQNIDQTVENKVIKKESKNGKDKKSNYLSEKIADSNFPFYGCAVCNISFILLTELDRHIATHKDRITSYGLRLKNQMKRKKLRKEQKKLKKLKKTIKKEKKIEIEIEIKPEGGYIGNMKTEDYKVDDSRVDGVNPTPDLSKKEIVSSKTSEKTDKDINIEKMFKCFACQKQFTLSYYLKLHVRSHTDEKPYTCVECGQCFITASKLGRHKKRIHLAIRHQCRICYKYFSRFEYLTKHFDNKHPEDKLEGEPYDYNAILPYLKEIEEQLQTNTEEQSKDQEVKTNSENLWDDWPAEEPNVSYTTDLTHVEGEPLIDAKDAVQTMDVVPKELDVIVKKEVDSDGYTSDNGDDKDSWKEENLSDSDYFPSNTWASSPKPMEDPSPQRSKRQKLDHPIKCKVCDKSISSQSYLQIHMRTHTGEKPFKCYICNRGFITASKMHRHVLTHESIDNEGSLKCETYSESGSDTAKKKKKRSKESTKRTKSVKSKMVEKSHHRKRPHACEYCQKRFLHLATLQVHKKSHEGEELVLKCHYCLMKMDGGEALRVHEASHEGPKPYLCTLCGKSYKKRETMMYHRKHHTAEKEFTCDICSKSFPSSRKLEKHIATHRIDQYVVRYECPVCAHMFNTKYHIKMHLVTHQKEGLIVEENRSEILAMVLQNARRIPKHPDAVGITDKVPPDEQSRMCNICGQVFQHFYYLEEHLKSHGTKIELEDDEKTEEKKHTCQVCSKSFKLHYYLKLHSFTHTKEKPYICQQCGKGFITRGKLKRHLETHTGLKKYQCHICYKFFTRPSYLRIHVRTIHGTQDYNFTLDKQFGVGNLTGWGQTV